MNLPGRHTTQTIESAVVKAVDFEITIADLARRSERRAWLVAWVAIVMSLLLAGGYYYMLPLKEKVPFLVMADAYTGTSTVARLTGDFTHRQLATSEAINRSNVAHFLLARESYDLDMMQLRDWRLVHTMSSSDVAAGYAAEHGNNNPKAPYHTYGRGRAIRVRILSLVLIGGSQHAPPKGATVRFQRSLYDKAAGTSRPLDSKIATLEFEYKANLKMDEQDRVENPLGFQVTSYRVDNDYAPAPTLEAETRSIGGMSMEASTAGVSGDSGASAEPVAETASAAPGSGVVPGVNPAPIN